MTRWEERIAAVFAGRFPRSSAAEKPGDSRPFRLTAEQLYPGFVSGSPDEKESFLEAAESLERRGLAHIRWAPRRKGEVLASLIFPDPEAFFAFMGKPSPSVLAAEARQTAALYTAESAPDEVVPYTGLFRFLAANIKPIDAIRGIDQTAVRDFSKLAVYLGNSDAIHTDPGTVRGTDGIAAGRLTIRALSIALYADSKRLEEIVSLFARLLSAAESRGIPVPELSLLDRSFPETMITGKLRFFFAGEDGAEIPPMENTAGAVIGLPLASVTRILKITPLEPCQSPSVLMVENKETFYTLAAALLPQYDAILYTAGHPNRAVRALTGVLANSGFSFCHAGDLDIDGILILQELTAMAGKPVKPVKMDGKTFEKYRCYGRSLEASMLRRAVLVNEQTRKIPGIAELISLIEETGLGVEQEIINYQCSEQSCGCETFNTN
jgi:hypothetical protein